MSERRRPTKHQQRSSSGNNHGATLDAATASTSDGVDRIEFDLEQSEAEVSRRGEHVEPPSVRCGKTDFSIDGLLSSCGPGASSSSISNSAATSSVVRPEVTVPDVSQACLMRVPHSLGGVASSCDRRLGEVANFEWLHCSRYKPPKLPKVKEEREEAVSVDDDDEESPHVTKKICPARQLTFVCTLCFTMSSRAPPSCSQSPQPTPEASESYAERPTVIQPSCAWSTTYLVCFLMVAVSGSCAAFYFGVDISKWLSPTPICVTPECMRLVDRLSASIDEGVNPCDDFYRFACGRGSRHFANSTSSSPTVTFLTSSSPALADPHKDILSRVHAILANWALDDRIQTPLQASASLYQQCVSVFGDQKKGVRHLLHFLQKCRINFAKADPDIEPLDAILNLDVRYNVKTLFDVAAVARMVLVRRRHALAPWTAQRHVLIKKHTYSDYLENTFTELGFPTRMRITFMAASVWEAEDVVLRLFAKVNKDDRKLIRFDYVEPGVMERPEWKAHLGRLWNRLAIKGASMAKFVKRVFENLTPLAITQHTFWEVVRQLGPLADYRLLIPEETAGHSKDRCFWAVYGVAGLAPLAVVVSQEVSTEAVFSATSFLTGLVRRVGATNVTLSVVDPRHLLQDTSAWSKPPARSDGAVDANEELPEVPGEEGGAGAFFKSYLRTLKAFRQQGFDSLDSLAPTFTTEDLLASGVSVEGNQVRVPTSLLVQPWFSPDVPRSFNFAGLGFAVVAELIRSGVKLHQRHLLSSSVPSGCNRTVSPDGRALEALERVLTRGNQERNWLRLPGALDAMSEQQLFFLAYCASNCYRNESAMAAAGGGECNDVLRATPNFGSAFKCAPGMRMYPKEFSHCPPTTATETSWWSLFRGGPYLTQLKGKIAELKSRIVKLHH